MRNRHLKRILYLVLSSAGIEPLKTITFVTSIPRYVRDLILYVLKANKKNRYNIKLKHLFPILTDSKQPAGSTSGHYFIQDLVVAKKIFKNNPDKHVDIGSRIDGFVAHIASFREIEVMDIRSNVSLDKNIVFKQIDFMKPIQKMHLYTDSISSLHAIEHFGLGRYGDPINPDGYIFALKNINLMLKKGGKFYFSVPMGPSRVEFNGMRVFSLSLLLDILKPDYKIDSFDYIDDLGNFNENISLSNKNKDKIVENFGCYYGCAIFELTKS